MSKDMLNPEHRMAKFVSSEMQSVYKEVLVAARTDLPVIITGETGTGKELIAREIHRKSQRSRNSFVVLDCTHVPASTEEAHIFGYQKGSYTGASHDEQGFFELANKGVLFIDELGYLQGQTQAKLLRPVEDGVVTRFGSKKPIQTDARIIASTNPYLYGNNLRRDLLYRLAGITIHVPTLTERREDIGPLVDFYVDSLNSSSESPKKLTAYARSLLSSYDFPGNVRDLMNILTYAFAHTEGNLIGEGVILAKMENDARFRSATGQQNPCQDVPKNWRDMKNKIYEQNLVEALRRNAGSLRRACDEMGTTHNTAASFIKKCYGSTLSFYDAHGIKPYKTVSEKRLTREKV